MSRLGLYGYFVFVSSWLLHLPARFPILGDLRLDLVLVAFLSFLAISKPADDSFPRTQTDTTLRILIAYAILTIPFVEWPGSVIRYGIPEFIKAVVFYYFTVAFVRTERDLQSLVFVFLACQLIRVLEPLYLHLTEGYWGSAASMADWEFMNRLSGAPYDVVNPNGLAFIVCTILPFLYFMAGMSWMTRLASVFLTPVCLYVLVLTASRTGILALIVIFAAILLKSNRRFLLGLAGILVVVIGFPLLGADTQDRYLSIIGRGEKNEATAEERVEGIESDILVAARRPIFGHGLGTSSEANANFGARNQISHNLFVEVTQELGLVGLVIFLFFLASIFKGFTECKRAYAREDATAFLPRLIDAMQVWLWMNFIFSFASYGLSNFAWYFLGGFSVAMRRLTVDCVAKLGGNENSRVEGDSVPRY